ncbi:23S rRNA (pseudouridine(1915)-N(3))-methyltransferase [hydrothermal vent metagenome]|uniref:23S rRNA (Pseudouridine(1915)-N(3))-methyltransferase n=1 Tax=hydrothermal vent metagenome TaxID=652676 RepID=A0A3B1A904_9ZZZZ
MRIQIIAIGERMPSWVQEGYQEYVKRIANGLSISLVEISAEKRNKSSNTPKILEKEAQRMLQAVGKDHYIIALDKGGQSWSTETLAARIRGWQQDGTNISILIGGPEGMTTELLQQAQLKLSFSAMTFPHPIIRVMLAEQIYRAYSIINNHPYHK